MNSFAPFVKMNGLGNQIIVADMRARQDRILPQAAVALSRDNNTTFDQIMAVYDPVKPGCDFLIEIWNRDGSLASACGNGTRCVVNWLYHETGKSHFVFATAGGIVESERLKSGLVCVDMGIARYDWSDIPLAYKIDDTNHVALRCGPLSEPCLVSIGNPHAVFFVDQDVDTYALQQYGPLLENDALFPERCNISIACVIDRAHMRIRTWERGAGLTRACGTAACASVVAGVRRHLTARNVEVQVPGGFLSVRWHDDGRVVMTGPTAFEFSGSFAPENGHYIMDQ